MDAVECMKAVTRMLKSGTIDCAIQKYISAQKKNDYEGMVEAAEQWAAAHPIKTRMSVFLEQWPDALLDNNGIINVNPCWLLKHYRGGAGDCTNWEKGCGECRREYWLAEVEEK